MALRFVAVPVDVLAGCVLVAATACFGHLVLLSVLAPKERASEHDLTVARELRFRPGIEGCFFGVHRWGGCANTRPTA